MAHMRNRIASFGWKKFENEFKAELVGELGAGKVKKAAIQILKDAQKDFVKSLPSEETYLMPFITGNLHDSIASVLSNDGRVIAAAYTDPVATEPSLLSGKNIYRATKGGGRKRIVGAVEAATDVRNMQGKYPKGLAATMLVAVPYAENPNTVSETNKRGLHAGYLDAIGSLYLTKIQRGLILYDAYGLFNWKGQPLSYNTPIGL